MSLKSFSQTDMGITLSSEVGKQVASELTLLDSYKIQHNLLSIKIGYLKNILNNKDTIILKLNYQLINQEKISIKKDHQIKNYQKINSILEQEKNKYKKNSRFWKTLAIVSGIVTGLLVIF